MLFCITIFCGYCVSLAQSQCTSSQFSCASNTPTNYKCIPDYWACDGMADCADNSDESSCNSPTPYPTYASAPTAYPTYGYYPNDTSDANDSVSVTVIVVIIVVILVVSVGIATAIYCFQKKRKKVDNDVSAITASEQASISEFEGQPSCLCGKKLIHYLFSFKPMILLFYALYSDVSALLQDLVMAGAFYISHPSFTCDDGDAVILGTCPASYSAHPLYIIALAVIVCSSIYGLYVFSYSFIKSPQYPTLEYYAFMVMTKRQRYFKYFLRFMYVVIIFLLILYIVGSAVLFQITGAFSPEFLGLAFSTMFLSGIAVSELRTTNEIHFEYGIIGTDEDAEFSKPIYLSPPTNACGCSLITAEDMFERLEEAVSLYAITKQTYLLEKILLQPTDKEIERVMKYYNYIYTKTLDQDSNEMEENVVDDIQLEIQNNTHQ